MKSVHVGIVYIAFGERYQAEARRSLASVQRVTPGLSAAVITDKPWTEAPVPEHFILRPGIPLKLVKPAHLYALSPFDKTIYLDADTVVLGDVGPLFDLLQYYDFALRFLGPNLAHEPGLLYHPYASSGILLFRKTELVESFFGLWAEAYQEELGNRQSAVPASGVPHDRSLGGAVARSGVRVVALSEHVFANLSEPMVLFAPPVICHGDFRGFEQVASYLSKAWDDAPREAPLQRVWLPNIRGLLPSGLRRSDPFLAVSLVLQRMVNVWRARKRGAS